MTRRPTPYLEVDVDRLDANVARAATWADEHGVALRPHAKTHKSRAVARRQLAAGAVGLSVATVAEAEVLADVCDDVLVAYPLHVDDARATRLRALAERVGVAIGVDSVAAGRRAATALRGSGVEVVVEVDSGLGRTGCPPADAAAVAEACGPLEVRGAFTFPGHSYRPGGGAPAAADESRALADAASVLGGSPVLSGGSTPSFAHADTSVCTELRPGVYVYGDAQQVELGECGADDVALAAVTTVVHARPGTVVVDAGSKVLGPDRPPWASGQGQLLGRPDVVVRGLWEHHGVLAWPEDEPLPALGERLRVAPSHACTAVNLAPETVVVTDREEVDVWPVDARGANA